MRPWDVAFGDGPEACPDVRAVRARHRLAESGVHGGVSCLALEWAGWQSWPGPDDSLECAADDDGGRRVSSVAE